MDALRTFLNISLKNLVWIESMPSLDIGLYHIFSFFTIETGSSLVCLFVFFCFYCFAICVVSTTYTSYIRKIVYALRDVISTSDVALHHL